MGVICTPSSSRKRTAGTGSISSPPTLTTPNSYHMKSAQIVSTTTKRKRAAAADDGLDAIKSTKRKRNVATATSGLVDVVDLTDDPSLSASTATTATPKKRKSKSTAADSSGAQTPERRARMFRKHPPRSYLEKLERATTQRYEISIIPRLSLIIRSSNNVPGCMLLVAPGVAVKKSPKKGST